MPFVLQIREQKEVVENEQCREDEAAEAAGENPQVEDAGAGGDGDDAEHVVDDELKEMGRALAAAEGELAQHREAMLRMQAEMENLRKRLIRDLEKSRRFALEHIMKDLLQVRDSLERGVEMTDAATTAEALREGKELTLKMLGKVLADHGLEEIDPRGEPFNPELHEAMTMQPSAEVPENTVLEVLQKGYRLHDRLIRPARVVVSRQP